MKNEICYSVNLLCPTLQAGRYSVDHCGDLATCNMSGLNGHDRSLVFILHNMSEKQMLTISSRLEINQF